MKNRRSFLQLLGLAPAVALAPKMLESGKATDITMLHPTGIPFADPPDPAGVIDRSINATPPMRYLGFAQLKNEGDPCSFDDEISEFAKEAFGPKPGRWPTPQEEET